MHLNISHLLMTKNLFKCYELIVSIFEGRIIQMCTENEVPVYQKTFHYTTICM